MVRHRKESKGIINRRVVVYCPEKGVEEEFSFNPDDFCPICNMRIDWEPPRTM